MRIVFLTASPPARSRSRSYVFATQLARRHEVTVLCLCRTPRDILDVGQLRAHGIQVTPVFEEPAAASLRTARALLGGVPVEAAFGESPRLREALWSEIERGDVGVVHVEQLRAAAIARNLPVPVIWDADVCSARRLRLRRAHGPGRLHRAAARLELQRMEPYERHLLRIFRHVVVSTEGELKHALAARNAGSTFTPAITDESPSTHVLPTAVDLDHFQPSVVRRHPNRLVFSGAPGDPANRRALEVLLRDIMPRIWRARPDVTLTLVGGPLPYGLSRLASDSRVVVAGEAPDVRPYLGAASVALSPLPYAVGTPSSVLEAMAMGTPVVASDAVAASLRAIPGADLLVGASPERFAHLVLRLLADDDLRHSVARSGRAYVERQHAAPAVTAQLEALYTVASGHNYTLASAAPLAAMIGAAVAVR